MKPLMTFNWDNALNDERLNRPMIYRRSKVKGLVMISVLLIVVMLILFMNQIKKVSVLTGGKLEMKEKIASEKRKVEDISREYKYIGALLDDMEIKLNNKDEQMHELSFTKKCIKRSLARKRPYMSNILSNEIEVEMLLNWINNKSKPKLRLVFQSDIDGDYLSPFNSKTSQIVPWMALIKTKSGSRFGCYSVLPIYGQLTLFRDLNDFLFSLDSRERYYGSEALYPLRRESNELLVIGDHDIVISNNYLTNSSYSRFPGSFGDKSNSTQRFILTKGEEYFIIEDLELFEVIL